MPSTPERRLLVIADLGVNIPQLGSDGKVLPSQLPASLGTPSGPSRVYLTQAQYDALAVKNSTVEYNIVANAPTPTPSSYIYLTQSDYDAIVSKDPNVEYNIVQGA